ncbi:hypothetical protein [Schlesneria paludicola]|uniref:hypothetical protein n=1 Tax=Schlesneria paludicola TaxID=360056 RepID=UPI0012F76B40|nr:hypothetical protein [Schlesneria paludicola]
MLVDDVPRANIHIQYVPQHGLAEKRERYLNRFFTWTGDGGRFMLSTYVNGDGVPHGEYALEFKWVEQKLAGEEDRFEGRYSNPTSPFMLIEVNGQRDLDLGTIRLKTRASPRD